MKSAKRPTILLLMSSDNARPFSEAAETLDVNVLRADNAWEARNCVPNDIQLQVVVTDVSLPDGNWADVFRWTVERGDRTNVIVRAPAADEGLWSEVLGRGGYDILVSPQEPEEVRRVIEGARQSRIPSGMGRPWSPLPRAQPLRPPLKPPRGRSSVQRQILRPKDLSGGGAALKPS